MILAPLADAVRYAGLHPRFAAAFAWAQDPANLARADGRYEIAPGLMVIVESGTTKDRAVRRLEAHRRKIDIQLVLAGPEIMEWSPLAGLRVHEDYKPEKDVAFYHDPAGPLASLLVAPGWFAIFWPEDAHKPVLHPAGQPVPYRKLVFKIDVDG